LLPQAVRAGLAPMADTQLVECGSLSTFLSITITNLYVDPLDPLS
jgi:hypothetical protein